MMEAPTRSASMDPSYGHSRTRTTSSSVFPSQHSQHSQHPQYQQQQYAQHRQPPPHSHQQQYTQHQHQHQQQRQHPHQLHPHHQHHPMHPGQQHHHHSQPSPQSASNPQLWRRSPSIGAFSNASSFQQPPPAAYRTSSSDLRRSTSSRSVTTQGGAGGGYVALLRKQKATVWCERAQYEDPRVVAQQRAAKMRANLEVVSGNAAGRTQTGLASAKVAGKIRHGKAPLVVGYAPGETHVGVGGVPLRLSAREIDGDGSDDDDNNTGPMMASRKEQQHHRRAGSSGRSSTGSGRRQHRTSGNGTPARNPSLVGTPERTQSFASKPPQPKQSIDESAGPIDDAASGRAQSSRSGNSERRDDVLELGQGPKLAHNSKLHSALTREKSVKSPEELKRRGSVDERTSTLTSGRLFIANPD
ncbi:hypothetical protein ISF_01633 [Cordyceps fumosorosea ARSEF 2679]|uniref:Uncharacterized protein n=1 Tax=Cordyceps fumosorosea (strain ARSEF 2679) TaxID=1081104 RepID=A0A168DFS8_CORFA|nr:hypothetical protein ISF_01633 [Cordyceps fumosorosea ARSEF 2679]OAA72560.1 hypothetical protein ISF_01633 [Cordyceps fumosorosea ARSEF 2679]